MKVKKRTPYILAVPLFIVATIASQLSGIGIGNASAATLVWDGSAGDGLFSTGENWNTGNAPVDNDVLSFSVAGLSASPVYTNDIVGLSVAGINVSGTSSAYAAPTITGNELTLTGNISNTATYNGLLTQLNIDSGIILGANVTSAGPVKFAGSGKTTELGSYNLTLTNTEGSCALSAGALAGSGTITFAGAADSQYSLPVASPSFLGAINVTSGRLYISAPENVDGTSLLTVSGSGNLSLYSSANSTWAIPLSLGGSGSIAAQHSSLSGCSGGGNSDTYTATVTAPVALTSDFKYSGSDNFKITGSYTSNGHAFTVQSGATGLLTTPEGETTAPVVEKEFSGDQPSTYETVGFNETATLSGTRGSVTVTDGGILKGTGTAQSLSLFDGGVVAPGNSPGTITVLETYSQNDSTYHAEILNATSYDQLAVGEDYVGGGNAVMLGSGAILQVVLYDGWAINAGDQFRIIDNLSSTAVSGTFDGLAEGAQLTVDGITFTISYVGGDGNDVVLTAVNGGVDAPNTGVQKLIMGNPVLVAGAGILAAATILFVAIRRKNNQ